MATTTRPSTIRQQGMSRFIWPISMLLVVVLLFLFYNNIEPNLQTNVANGINDWLPVATFNESMVWIIMALGLNVVVGYAGLLDLGYVAFWAIGGYTAGWLMAQPWANNWTFHLLSPTYLSKAPGIHVTFWLVLIVAGVVCAIAGIIIGAPTLRLRGDYLALVTLGFGEMIGQVARNGSIAGVNITNGDTGISSAISRVYRRCSPPSTTRTS
jgi:branched-chain amino acid transport system permease protein